MKICFSNLMPSKIYLSYHIREVLRKNDVMFAREYPNIKN